ncbi:ComEA family DNA-binding protein [Sulfurospirillum deleyianum]|uniref:Competence protein ComEA helix-hairpin-helix repeat protein n=1 Tax=Sulfurospirillum deleyianum (strain ATCC 51133 / DSM 6946 / 5175) TaxID=525898 RepID=D1B3M3_SULD5|nr:helix-hairpin-helix domain-containing protein [Sulfurospirillum deleyianum]ACZ12693.1 competence protein ComEA helix-hairpin-helix repeat protein [Sulfurospirillum deleyianum DSM 6946]
MLKFFMLFLFLVASLWAKVDINSASLSELSSLRGIGEKKAQAIVEYRTQKGKFNTIDELVHVKGIGPKILESIKSDIEVK